MRNETASSPYDFIIANLKLKSNSSNYLLLE